MVKQKKKKQIEASSTIRFDAKWTWVIALVILTGAVYFNTLNNDFLSNWDDDAYIIRNRDITSFSWEHIKNMFSTFYVSNFQPLTIIVYALEFKLFGYTPKGYHFVNLLFHLINVGLVFELIRKLFKTNRLAFFVAAMFAIHPTRIESIAWVAELKDVLYACFFLLSINQYLKYTEVKEKKYLYYSVLFFLASTFSKSMAVTLSPLLLLIDYFLNRKLTKEVIVEKIPFFLISIVIGVVALKSQSGKAMNLVQDFGFVDKIILVFYSIVLYFQKLLLPYNLSAIHYYPSNKETLPLLAWISPLVLVSIGFLTFKIKSLKKELIFGLLFFMITIGIVIQIIPFGYAIIAERYSYIPFIGLFVIIGVVISTVFKENKMIANLLGIGLITILSIITFNRNKTWKNSIILFTDVAEKYPKAEHARWLLGNIKKDYKMYDKCIIEYNKAIELDPTHDMAYFNRGSAYASLKLHKKALLDYDKTIELNPTYVAAYNNRGNSKLQLKNPKGALEDYNKVLEIDSTFSPTLIARADLYNINKEYQKAVNDYNKGLGSNANNANALYNRGVAYYNLNNKAAACTDWQRAASLGYNQSEQMLVKYCK